MVSGETVTIDPLDGAVAASTVDDLETVLAGPLQCRITDSPSFFAVTKSSRSARVWHALEGLLGNA